MKNRLLSDFTKYVSLNVLGMIGLSCYILADTFFISLALGADGLAALTLALPAYNVIHGAGLMLGLGGATQCAVLWARGRGHDARQTIAHTVALGLILGALFLTAGAAFAPQLATLLGAEGAAAPLAADYLRVILCFAPCFLLNNIFLALVRNDRNPRLAMAAMLAGSLSNIVLDYVLMFPLGMGMTARRLRPACAVDQPGRAVGRTRAGGITAFMYRGPIPAAGLRDIFLRSVSSPLSPRRPPALC